LAGLEGKYLTFSLGKEEYVIGILKVREINGMMPITSGSDIVSKTNEDFGKAAAGAKKVGGLVGEIAAASREQAQRIEQINIAMTEMDKVMQQNALNADESAKGSEAMNVQAERPARIG